MMVVDGDIPLAEATCPPAAVFEDLFKTLLRVRQAEFEAQEGVNNPDAWDTGAAEPGAAIDLDRQLDVIRLGICSMASALGGQDHVASLARRGTPETSACSVRQKGTVMVRGLAQCRPSRHRVRHQ